MQSKKCCFAQIVLASSLFLNHVAMAGYSKEQLENISRLRTSEKGAIVLPAKTGQLDNSMQYIVLDSIHASENHLVLEPGAQINTDGINLENEAPGVMISQTSAPNAKIILKPGSKILSGANSAILVRQTGALIVNEGKIDGRRGINAGRDNSSNLTVINGPQGEISSSGKDQAIMVNFPGFKLINSGKIFQNHVLDGTGAVTIVAPFSEITLNKGSLIEAASLQENKAHALKIRTFFSSDINNSGTLSVTGRGAALSVGQDIDEPTITGMVNNLPGGVIQELGTAMNAKGAAILFEVDIPAGFINYPGAKVIANQGFGILITKPFSGNITNQGELTVVGKSGIGIINQASMDGDILNQGMMLVGPQSYAMVMRAPFKLIHNQVNGVIQALDEESFGIGVGSDALEGFIKNDGAIHMKKYHGIYLNNSIKGIHNTGIIDSENMTPIVIANNITLSQGIVNDGSLINAKANSVALNLSPEGYAQTNIPLVNNGFIQGDVFLSGLAEEKSFIMNKGKIQGAVFAQSVKPNTLMLNGGEITGEVNLGAKGDIVYLNGTKLNQIHLNSKAPSTIYYSKGNFNGLYGKGAEDKLIIQGQVNPGEIKNIPTLVVESRSVLEVNAPITALKSFKIQPKASVHLDTVLEGTGNVSNTGTLELMSSGSLIMGSFEQSRQGHLIVHLNNKAAPIILQNKEQALNLESGSQIELLVHHEHFIPHGTTFDLIKVNGNGQMKDYSTLNPAHSPVMRFEKLPIDNNTLKVAVLYDFNKVGPLNEVTFGINQTIHDLSQDPNLSGDLGLLISQLSALSNDEILAAYLTLVPPYSYGQIRGARLSFDQLLSQINQRVKNLRPVTRMSWNEIYGMNAGDESLPYVGTWAKGFGSHANQKFYAGSDGYRAHGGGGVLGIDWNYPDCMKVGIAGSLSKFNVRDKGLSLKRSHVKSYQGALYWEYLPFSDYFIDASIALSRHHFHDTHPIIVNLLGANSESSFRGTQYGAQMDVGRTFTYANFSSIPWVRLKYSHLSLQDHVENGAGDLNLAISKQHFKELEVGLGLRFALDYQFDRVNYEPVFSAMLGYEFYGDGQNTIANFVGGGIPFNTQGPRSPQTKGLFDLGVNIHMFDGYRLGAHYELEVRDRFVSHTGFLDLYYQWC